MTSAPPTWPISFIARSSLNIRLTWTGVMPRGVGDMLLTQRKGEAVAVDQPALREARMDQQDQAGDAFGRGALAERDQAILIEGELACKRLAEAVGKIRIALHVFDDAEAVDKAQPQFGEALGRIAQPIDPKRLERDRVAGQREPQDLATPVRQQFEIERPALLDQGKFSGRLTLAIDGASRRHDAHADRPCTEIVGPALAEIVAP